MLTDDFILPQNQFHGRLRSFFVTGLELYRPFPPNFKTKLIFEISQQSAVDENVQLGAMLPALSGLRPLTNLTVSITKGKDFYDNDSLSANSTIVW